MKFGDENKEINLVSDLTFNQYIQLMRKGDNWNKIGLPLDKDEFTKKLETIRDIRVSIRATPSCSTQNVVLPLPKITSDGKTTLFRRCDDASDL